jgi:hypothetical protein
MIWGEPEDLTAEQKEMLEGKLEGSIKLLEGALVSTAPLRLPSPVKVVTPTRKPRSMPILRRAKAV